MKPQIIAFLLVLFYGTIVSAQQDLLGVHTSNIHFVRLNYENDFFTQTDEYYTQGIKLESESPAFTYSPIMLLLPHLKNSVMQFGLSAVQDCFTPTSITSPTILHGDRPFAGYIYLGHYKISSDLYKKQKLTSEIDLGEIGLCAECKQEQEAIHKATNNAQPDGWQYQIGTGLFLDYKLRYEKALYVDTAIDIDAVGQLNAGTVYDNALLGITLHLGKMHPYFSGNRTDKFQLYGIVQAWAEGVGYNGTLQGALFTKNSAYTLPQNEMNRVVFGDSYGLCLSHGKISAVYSVTLITNEIITGTYHGWGHIDITYYL